MKADLHIHTTKSDSSLNLSDVFRQAKNLNIECISITDHETVPNVKLMKNMADAYNIKVISGIELICRQKDKTKAHILGYNIKDYSKIKKICEDVIKQKHSNSLEQLEAVQKAGYDITIEDVWKVTDKPCIYTQAIGLAMYEKGYVDNPVGKWYKEWFGVGSKYYLNVKYLTGEELIEAIVEGGGSAVLAHPGQQKNFALVPSFIEAGMTGIEYIHPSNNKQDMDVISKIAKENNLFITGGSDAHGITSNSGGKIGDYIIDVDNNHPLFMA